MVLSDRKPLPIATGNECEVWKCLLFEEAEDGLLLSAYSRGPQMRRATDPGSEWPLQRALPTIDDDIAVELLYGIMKDVKIGKNACWHWLRNSLHGSDRKDRSV